MFPSNIFTEHYIRYGGIGVPLSLFTEEHLQKCGCGCKVKAQKEEYANSKYHCGGVVVGNSHADGGVRFRIKRTGRPVELEGQELVLSDVAMLSSEIFSVKGTPREIIEELNQKAGEWKCEFMSEQKVVILKGGEGVINKKSAKDKKVYSFKGTARQIASRINQLHDGVKFD